jgi:hypothetical protein
MTRLGATVGSLVFAVGQPGVMGGLVPYWITGGWEGAGAPLALQVAAWARRSPPRPPSTSWSVACTATCATRCTSR